MIWDGETVYTTWGYQPLTRWAVSYKPGADGYPIPRDPGASEDAYEAAVSFRGPEDELVTLEEVLAGNRQAFNITCGAGEEIFGADIDYSGALSVTVREYGQIDRVSYGQYAMPLKLRIPAPTFQGTASLSALRLSSWRYGAFSKFNINKRFSKSGAASYLDHRMDPGVFVGEFTQTTTEMRAIRRALLSTIRGTAIQFPELGGITYPFGTRRPEWRFLKANVLEWEDLGRENFTDWKLRIVFAEAFPYFPGGSSDADSEPADFLVGGTSGTPDLEGVPPEV